ncbi:MAG: acetylglutamate kinase [Phycisphaerae bacterium]|nr:acetylglutamate kinase [Phycisphaerae bacterium]
MKGTPRFPPGDDAAPVVLKIGGEAIDAAEPGRALWRALSELHAELAGGLVVVHGGGAVVDARLARLGMVSEKRDGLRVTPPQHMEEIVASLAGVVNAGLVGKLRREGAPAVGLTLGDGGASWGIPVVRSTDLGFDPGRVGRVAAVQEVDHGLLLRVLVRARFMPVVCSIGLDDAGEPLNVNADDAAEGIATLLDASALVLLTDVRGILDARGELVREIDPAGIERLIDSGVIRSGMATKARSAARAATVGGRPVVIASWKHPAELVGLSGRGGAGTRVVIEHPDCGART